MVTKNSKIPTKPSALGSGKPWAMKPKKYWAGQLTAIINDGISANNSTLQTSANLHYFTLILKFTIFRNDFVIYQL